jgi:hypothetical protein
MGKAHCVVSAGVHCSCVLFSALLAWIVHWARGYALPAGNCRNR